MEHISKYFNAEKNESYLFILIGILAVGIGAYFLFKNINPFYKGIAYPIILIALIQITVGTTIVLRTSADIKNAEQYHIDKGKINEIEIPRMKKVMDSFSLYKKIEIALIIIGIAMFVFFKNKELLKGIGLGLVLQSIIMLTLDLFAEARGKKYIEELKSYSQLK
nr:hypothetical protein [Bacteroidota bacterium]